jgi:hypothetical protein
METLYPACLLQCWQSIRTAVIGRIVRAPEISLNCSAMAELLIRPDHESLEVTLAYLKGKDAESKEAQEHANNSSLALYA